MVHYNVYLHNVQYIKDNELENIENIIGYRKIWTKAIYKFIS